MIGWIFAFSRTVLKLYKFGLLALTIFSFVVLSRFDLTSWFAQPNNRRMVFVILPALYLLDFLYGKYSRKLQSKMSMIYESFIENLDNALVERFGETKEMPFFVNLYNGLSFILIIMNFALLAVFLFIFTYIDEMSWQSWLNHSLSPFLTFRLLPALILADFFMRPVFCIANSLSSHVARKFNRQKI